MRDVTSLSHLLSQTEIMSLAQYINCAIVATARLCYLCVAFSRLIFSARGPGLLSGLDYHRLSLIYNLRDGYLLHVLGDWHQWRHYHNTSINEIRFTFVNNTLATLHHC